MTRLIGFSLAAILIAWTELEISAAVGVFLFFATCLFSLRAVVSFLIDEVNTWPAWRERITQVVIFEVAGFSYLSIHDQLMDFPKWWGYEPRVLLIALEVLPPLIFLLLAWGVVKVSFAKKGTRASEVVNPICGECGSLMTALPMSWREPPGFECSVCGARSMPEFK